MTDLEALMWRLEQLDPMFRPYMCLAVLLDRPADPSAVVARVASVVRRIPRLSERVVAGPLPTVPPRWHPDPDFDLQWHLRRYHEPHPDLIRVAERVALSSIDPERPPWQVFFVDGLPGDRQGVVFKLHHSYTDGLGAVRLAAELFDLERHSPSEQSPGAEPRRGPGPPSLADDLIEEGRRTLDLLASAGPWLRRALRDMMADPSARAAQARSVVQAATDDARQYRHPGSPLWATRSAGAHFAGVGWPLADLKRAAARTGATVNDVFLAGLLGGVSRYHEKLGPVPPSLRLAIPISTRETGDDAMQNQLLGALLRGPLRLANPVERIRLVHEMVLRARRQPYLALAEPLTSLAMRVPGAAEVAARALRSLDLLASNVPGPPVGLYFAGARIERMVPFGPRSGAALNATLISYDGSVLIGLNSDPSAVTDSGVLADCVEAGLEEVTA